MRIRSFKYYFREAFLSIFRNRLMSVASIVTVFSCIFIVVVFMALIINIDGMLAYLEDYVGISVYLEDKADANQINALYTEISNIEYVTNVTYVSSEDALQRFIEDWGDDAASIMSDIAARILPRSFDVEIEHPRYQPDVVATLEAIKNGGIGAQDPIGVNGMTDLDGSVIQKIRHAQDIVDILLGISTGVRIICGALILLLAVICFIIIVNTIKITVNTRKMEINIMKFIGATDWFIRWPFVIEGFLIGFLGSIFPITICWLGYDKVISIFYQNQSFSFLHGLIYFKSSIEIFTYVVPVALVFGALIGVIGSVSSIQKHLSV